MRDNLVEVECSVMSPLMCLMRTFNCSCLDRLYIPKSSAFVWLASSSLQPYLKSEMVRTQAKLNCYHSQLGMMSLQPLSLCEIANASFEMWGSG